MSTSTYQPDHRSKREGERLAEISSLKQAMQDMQQQLAKMATQLAELEKRSTPAPDSSGPLHHTPSASSPLSRAPSIAAGEQPVAAQSLGRSASAVRPATASAWQREAHADTDDDDDSDSDDEWPLPKACGAQRGTPAYDKRVFTMKRWLRHRGVVIFYGQLSRDGDNNALDWTRHISAELHCFWRGRTDGQLDVVRSFLAGPAAVWLDRRVHELTNEQQSGAIEWGALEEQFVLAHVDYHTRQKARAQLDALRFGSKQCPTPCELHLEFDRLTDIVCIGQRHSPAWAPALVEAYENVVAASSTSMFRRILEGVGLPDTIEEWKQQLTRQWLAEKRIEAMDARFPNRHPLQQQQQGGQSGQQQCGRGRGRGSGRGRGARGGYQR